jgi:isoleucyl-tRNA synthetase
MVSCVRAGNDDFKCDFRAIFLPRSICRRSISISAKDALYCDGDTERRRAALTVLDHPYARLTTWLAPILTFTMEEVWLERRPDTSVHLVDFPDTDAWRDDELAARSETVRAWCAVHRRWKNSARPRLSSSLEASPTVYLSRKLAAIITAATFADLCISQIM